MYKTESFAPETFKPSRFEADGKVTLRGQEITYHTVSEDNVFYSPEGKPLASIYSYSYFRTNVENAGSRPIIFGFNGGPGTSSMYVHAGFLAPFRMKYVDESVTGTVNTNCSLPPYEMIENQECLLDIADIVVIDPVGVGYGVLLDESAKNQFYGVEEDAEALLNFIEMWLHRYNRWNSPKYLVGESYGCTRASTAIGMSVNGGKERTYGVRFDGTVLIGTTVTPGGFFRRGLPVEMSVLNFPTYAATNWYHNHPSTQTLEEFAMEAKKFADTEYLLALYRGESVQGEEREQMLDKIHYYTGVSKEYLEANCMRIDEDTFRAEILKDRKLAVGRCDSRFTRPLYTPLLAENDPKHALRDDAVMDHYDGYFFGGLTGTILPKLGVKLDRNYIASLKLWMNWNGEAEGGTTAERLRDGMNKTFGLRTFFANGWYDACTEIGLVYYTMDHAGFPKDRCYVKGYPSGHMIYIGEENIKELCDDMRTFILGGDPSK